MKTSAFAVASAFVAACLSLSPGLFAEEGIRFNRDIRPILAENCFSCHGPDRNKRQADLRLDTVEGLHGVGDGKAAIHPGKPHESKLVERIETTSADEIMPPPESGKTLKPAEIALLKRWIAEGGAFEGHWAFLPRKHGASPTAVADPKATDMASAARFDSLIEAKLAELRLPPANEADKVTLLRRLSFDLTGLPPKKAEVDQFLADSSPQAYENLVDRLLASPHYGERMAMWWLDLVRYADTVGYHGDQNVSISPFRNYVIASFNANKPFDQFTREQIAGDLLPNPNHEQLIASGYNRLGMMSAEGGVQDKEYLAKYMAERVRNASGAWLGVTIGCAECHDHKFDPFTTRDFYRFGAFFADIKEKGLYSGSNDSGTWGSSIKDPTPEQQTKLDELLSQIQAVQAELQKPTPELTAAQVEWEKTQIPWTELKPERVLSKEGATLTIKEDHSILASGASPTTDTYTLHFKNLPEKITAIRLEALTDETLPQRGPGRAGNGNFVLSEFSINVKPAAGELQAISLQNATATFEQTDAAQQHPFKKFAIASTISKEPKQDIWGWAVAGQTGKPHVAVFETEHDLTVAATEELVVSLAQNLKNPRHTLGRFRISVTTTPRPIGATDSAAPALAAILAVPSAARSEAQQKELAAYYRGIAPLLAPKRQEMAAQEESRKDLEAAIATSLITEHVEPRMIRVLARGNWMDEKGDVVTPAFPKFLSPQEDATRKLTRLDLANWIVSPDQPLTSRVLANRIWKQLFGVGLSRKLDDLGAQGEWPSHPELLEELAQSLVDVKWDIKRFIKVIVMTKAYRRASQTTPEVRERDPGNRWLARQGRFRLDAELVRDNALSISGLLVEKVGGKSVFPYQPPGYWAYLNFPQREWQNGAGEDLYRRGLYTHWQRQYLHPSLLVFDAPSREECTADRARSNTPLQSLALLNDPSYVEAARAFAESVLRQPGDDAVKLDYAFRQTLSRPGSPEETKILTGLLESQRAEYKLQPNAAKELAANGARRAAADLDPIELAAWTSIARALLNLHETITRY